LDRWRCGGGASAAASVLGGGTGWPGGHAGRLGAAFEPTPFGFNGAKKGLSPVDYR
jgi:hypothetical protein